MATVVSTLYPPIVASFMTAFINNTDATVYFSLSSYNSSTDIKHVHVSVVNQLNNEDALNTASGIIFSDLNYDTAAGMYSVTIPVTKIQGNQFNINQFYKVQLRFDSCDWDTLPVEDRPDTEAKISDYLLTYQQYFSEWSSVCLIKPILEPHIRIKIFDNYNGTGKQSFNKGIIPIAGGVYFGNNDVSETETLQSYQISVLDRSGIKTLYKTPIIYTGENVNPNNINYKFDLQNLDTSEDIEFKMRISITTKNQYKLSADYDFQIEDFLDEEAFRPDLSVKMDDENGIAILTVKNERSVLGTLYIKRSSSIDNFQSVESIYTAKQIGPIDLEIKDNTVGSLTWYKYTAQFENEAGAFTQVYTSPVFYPNFYDAIISRGKQQYNIKYNYSVTGLKPVVNRAKIDTLGGRYPKFAENAVLKYKQFNIKGLISAEADVYEQFLDKNKVYSGKRINYYNAYKQDQNLRDLARNDVVDYIKENGDRYPSEPIIGTTSQRFMTTTQNDWMWEREFREQLVSWLNDGEPKLYRSMAEGSMVVMLTDINLTPTAGMFRFLWDFSATVYEIADSDSLQKLDELGIYKITKLPDELTGSGSGGGTKPEPQGIEVVTVGQMYQHEITEKEDIRNLILEDLQKKYGKQGDLWDSQNVLSDKMPDDLYLKNVKIFFHNQPNLYWVDDQGNPQWVNGNNFDPSQNQENKISLGYSFDVVTSASIGQITIFVNEKGYYQIPDDLDVKSLSFNHIGDIVTIEYTLVYKEKNNLSQMISGNTVSRTVIGQEQGVFKPKQYLGEKIRSKYNFIKTGSYSERMQYWKGICLDVTPFAVVYIQYYRDDLANNPYVVGETGVLHLLKNFEVKDLYFAGRRMKYRDLSRQPYLEEWEYCLDNSVQHNQGILLDSQEASIIYYTENDIEEPKNNTVYNINGKLRIYYQEHWYNFSNLEKDETNIIENTATEPIGLAEIPIEGQINYYGTVIKSSFA